MKFLIDFSALLPLDFFLAVWMSLCSVSMRPLVVRGGSGRVELDGRGADEGRAFFFLVTNEGRAKNFRVAVDRERERVVGGMYPGYG
jgi:hypothetical protein